MVRRVVGGSMSSFPRDLWAGAGGQCGGCVDDRGAGCRWWCHALRLRVGWWGTDGEPGLGMSWCPRAGMGRPVRSRRDASTVQPRRLPSSSLFVRTPSDIPAQAFPFGPFVMASVFLYNTRSGSHRTQFPSTLASAVLGPELHPT